MPCSFRKERLPAAPHDAADRSPRHSPVARLSLPADQFEPIDNREKSPEHLHFYFRRGSIGSRNLQRRDSVCGRLAPNSKGGSVDSKYSFCRENRGHLTGFHIRKLRPSGRRLVDRADTLALCGRRVEYDLTIEVTEPSLETEGWRTCDACKEEWRSFALAAARGRLA
jgi:hypothetical protein